MSDAVVAVTTMKADPDQVEKFLSRNLAGGVDHFLVFLDERNPPVRTMLEQHPHVTVVRTGPKYWNGTRPPRVSDRLRINMNVANAVLATLPSVGWMVSIDSDEALAVDRRVLSEVEEPAVLLSVWEAVSRRAWPDDEPTLFKAAPSDGELVALSALGVIDDPDLRHYFRGHHEGKPALRPDLRVRVKVHFPVDEAGERLGVRVAGCQVLHYESHSLLDFVRRWADYAPAASHLRTHREERKRIGIALHTLQHHDQLDEPERELLVGRLFDRLVADDVETLDALGLLRRPPAGEHRPQLLPGGDTEHLRLLLEALLPADKHVFNDGGTAEEVAVELIEAADRLAGSGSDVTGARVRSAINTFRDGREPRTH